MAVSSDKTDLLQKTSFAQQWAAAADKIKERLKETGVPIIIYTTEKSFWRRSKETSLNWCEDMTIQLKEGAPDQMDCKTYPLSQKELEILRTSLDEDLKKGYIKHGTSSYVSPIFFIPKKDGEELRMVIDY